MSSSDTSSALSTADILLNISEDLDRHRTIYLEPVEPIPKVKKGLDYKIFKPKSGDGLYFSLVQDPQNSETVAKQWILSWQEDKAEAIMSMVQLFVCIAGCQLYNVKANWDKCGTEGLIQDILKDVNFSQNGECLLEKKTDWAECIKASLSLFTRVTVTVSVTRGFFYEDIFQEAFRILAAMCKSNHRLVYVTGIFFAVNFCVPLAEHKYDSHFFKAELKRYSREYEVDLTNSSLRCQSELNFLQGNIHYLMGKVLSECSYYDQKLAHLYAYCAKKFVALYILLDENIYQREILKFYKKHMLVEWHENTRITIMQCLGNLFKHRLFKVEEHDVEGLVIMLEGVTRDSNIQVAVEALRALTVAIKHNSVPLPDSLLMKVFYFVYNESYTVSKEAGSLFIAHNRQVTGGNFEDFFLSLVSFQSNRMFKGLAHILVESILHCAPELTSPKPGLQLLLQGNLEFSQEVVLLEIITFAVLHVMMGKSLFPREDSVTMKISLIKQDELLSQVIPVLSILFEKYFAEADCLKNLLLIMKNLPYERQSVCQYKNDLVRTFKIYIKIFNAKYDQDILLMISEALQSSSVELSVVKLQSDTVIRAIADACYDVYDKCILETSLNADVENAINGALMKIAVIGKYNDLPNDKILSPLPDFMGNKEEIVLNKLKSECSILSQNMKELGRRKRRDVTALKEKYLDIVEQCCSFLNDATVVNKAIMLSEILDLFHMRGRLPAYPTILPELTEEQISTLCLHVEYQLTKKTAYALEILMKIIKDIGVIPSGLMWYTWALYHKLYHFYGKDYDKCLNDYFKAKPQTTCIFILGIITTEHRGLVTKGRTACESSKELQELAMRLAILVPKNFKVKIIEGLIRYANKMDANMEVLSLLALWFCNSITIKDKINLVRFVEVTFKGEKMSDNNVKALLERLKRQMTSK